MIINTHKNEYNSVDSMHYMYMRTLHFSYPTWIREVLQVNTEVHLLILFYNSIVYHIFQCHKPINKQLESGCIGARASSKITVEEITPSQSILIGSDHFSFMWVLSYCERAELEEMFLTKKFSQKLIWGGKLFPTLQTSISLQMIKYSYVM